MSSHLRRRTSRRSEKPGNGTAPTRLAALPVRENEVQNRLFWSARETLGASRCQLFGSMAGGRSGRLATLVIKRTRLVRAASQVIRARLAVQAGRWQILPAGCAILLRCSMQQRSRPASRLA